MRQISGVWRRDGSFELAVHPSNDTFTQDGVQLVVLGHTARAPSARHLMQRYRPGHPHELRRHAPDCAFVLFDAASHTGVLARDELGTTPLYYVASEQGFAFATRIADVVKSIPGGTAPNRKALAALLVDFAGPPADETFFEGVRAVPPGGVLRYHDHKSKIYPRDAWPDHEARISYGDAVSEFARLFRDAVAVRVDANAPTAVLVSGGLDSAAIISTAARAGDAFGITYGLQDGGPADESRYTDALQRSGMRIERVPFYPTTDVNAIEQSVREGETPIADQVTLTLQRAAACARVNGAHALMLGTWGDQVLAPFPPPHIARIAPWHTGRLNAAARAYQQYMTDVPRKEIYDAFVRQSLRRVAPDWLLKRRRNRARAQSMFDVLAQEFGPPPVERTATSFRAAVWRSVSAPAQIQAIEGTTKWGLANGVDARLPFVDVPLLRFLTSLPDAHAYRGNALKPLLRDALENAVPKEVLARRDKGDYTSAIAQGAAPVKAMIERMNELEDLVDLGLMSRASAAKSLARCINRSEIGGDVHTLAQLMGVSAWLQLFFRRTT